MVIADATSSIRLPPLTGALRSAPLGESFLFQDYMEEAIKIQKSLDPIPTKRASGRNTTPWQTTREDPLGSRMNTVIVRQWSARLPSSQPGNSTPQSNFSSS
jgi:hypothetical protein